MANAVSEFWEGLDKKAKRLGVIVAIITSLGFIWTFLGLPGIAKPDEMWRILNNKKNNREIVELKNQQLVTTGILRSLLEQIVVTDDASGVEYTLYETPDGDKFYFVDCCKFYTAIYNYSAKKYYIIGFDGEYSWCSDLESDPEKREKFNADYKSYSSAL